METQAIIFVALGVVAGWSGATVYIYNRVVNKYIQQIATMRKEGYIYSVPAEPRPDVDEPWMDIAEL